VPSLNRNDNIEVNLNEMWPGDTDWIHLILDKVQWYFSVITVVNIERLHKSRITSLPVGSQILNNEFSMESDFPCCQN
jgi:hypothetical protein